MALTSEGIKRRLRLLESALGHFSEGVTSLRTYQEEYGQDGFVHSVIELAGGASGALSTSIGILQAFRAQSTPPSGRRQQPAAPEDVEQFVARPGDHIEVNEPLSERF